MLTRPEFDSACKALIAKYGSGPVQSPATDGLRSWSWNEHTSYPGFGYMSRTVVYRRKSGALDSLEILPDDQVEEEADDAVVSHSSVQEALLARQYIVYSPTFRVPAFYFTMHDSHGCPLSLKDLVNTSLFQTSSLAGTEATSFGLSHADTSFPLLSQGDHPTLGTPCWYFHPCETGPAVNEVMGEVHQDSWTDEQRLVRWMEAWLMVVGTVVCIGRST